MRSISASSTGSTGQHEQQHEQHRLAARRKQRTTLLRLADGVDDRAALVQHNAVQLDRGRLAQTGALAHGAGEDHVVQALRRPAVDALVLNELVVQPDFLGQPKDAGAATEVKMMYRARIDVRELLRHRHRE